MEWVKLGDVTSIAMGKTPSRSNYNYWDGDNTWVSIADLKEKYIYDSKEKITENAVKESKIKLVPENTVIMSFKLSIGKVAITKIPLYTNEAIAHFLPKEDIIPEYLYYALQSIDYNKYVDKAVKGKTLNLKKLNNIEVPICSLDEQKYYYKLFNYVENLIQTRQDQIQALDDLVESVFNQMFGDIQENNKLLISKKLGDVVKANQGLQIAKSQRFDIEVENSYKYITIKYLNGNSDAEYIQNPQASVICNKDDILVARTGNTGQIVTGVEGVFHNNFFKVNYDKNQFNKTYLYRYLTNKKIQDKMLLLAGTSTIPDLNHKDFYSIDVLIPPIEKQNQFAAFVEKIEKQKQILNDSLGNLTDLFDSLMQDAFDGSMTK